MLACTRLALHKGKEMSEKIYGDRDLMAMDIAGNHYCRHVDHMTREKLHSKSDIAAELGWRDMQIAALQQKLDAVLAENVALKEQCAGEMSCAANDIAYAIFNLADMKMSDLKPGIIESTGPAETALIAERNLRNIAAQLRAETNTTPSQYESLAGGK